MVGATVAMREGAVLVGEHGYRYLLVKALGQSNVWVAVDSASQEKIFIVKQPSDDDVGFGWPRFQHEMVMHELLKGIPTIRQQVDRIPPTSSSDPPRIVLEILESTLWDARKKRQFSDVELKGIMRSAMLGLRDIHSRNLVYADLKMQNILLSGFESEPNNKETVMDSNISAKLGDLGIVMEPTKGLVQPIVYRAPEVYFRNEISSAADIWSWGVIYCQLLEAQASFHKYGLYDDLLQGAPSQVQKERSVERALAHDFGLGALDYYDGCALPYHDRTQHEGQHWERLKTKGLPEKEIQFLRWVLNPVPTDRPTAQEVLESGWFTTNTNETNRIAETLKKSSEASRRRNLQRKGSEPMLYTRAKLPPANPNLPVAKDARAPIEIAAQTALPPPAPLAGQSQQSQQEQPMVFQSYQTTSSVGSQQSQQSQLSQQQQHSQQSQQQQHSQQSQQQLHSQQSQQQQHSQQPQQQQHSQESQQQQPMAFTPFQPTPFKPVNEAQNSRPTTPRSSTHRPGGTTFMDYGSFMR